ncbi:UNKNOWN [Stylonychia lemnae]|uniref:Uncharacterized protein n=1 Tax=Stylonychia lemnae TaxID=5949 RepID=A0A078AQJ8_STYLE|nr:UNKNOWN [Stylonychia lemnae]|eukprot:CDW84449.1 UNKNOWN [Stylonychia lemnae]
MEKQQQQKQRSPSIVKINLEIEPSRIRIRKNYQKLELPKHQQVKQPKGSVSNTMSQIDLQSIQRTLNELKGFDPYQNQNTDYGSFGKRNSMGEAPSNFMRLRRSL